MYVLVVIFVGLFGHPAQYREAFPDEQSCLTAADQFARTFKERVRQSECVQPDQEE